MAIPTLQEAADKYAQRHSLNQAQPQSQPQSQEPQPQAQTQPQPQVNQGLAEYIASKSQAQQPQQQQTIPMDQAVAEYNPYAADVPQNVIESQQQTAHVNIATQEYADDMTERIIRDRNGYLTDDNYQGMLNKTYTLQTYDYLKRANKGADDSAWGKSNPEDPLFSNLLPDWIKEQEDMRRAKEAYDKQTPTEEDQIRDSAYKGLTTKAQREIMNANEIEHGNWNLMNWWDRAKYLLMPGSSATTMDDTPEWAKYIQNIFPSVMAGGAGAMVGSLIPIPGAGLVTGAIVGGLSYLQGVTGIDIPVINKLQEGLDILSVWTEQAQGAIGSAMAEARNQLQGKDGAGLLDFINTAVSVLKDNPSLFEVSKYSYEVSADFGLDDLILFIRNTGAKVSDNLLGTNFGQRSINDISRANIGRSGFDEVLEDTQGYGSLLNTYVPVFDGLVDAAMQQGMTKKEAFDFAHANMEQYLVNYMGTTGLGRDLVASSIADPQNLIPFVSAKAAEGIGKSMVDNGKANLNAGLEQSGRALQNAGKAAVGNPLIDMLPPGVQQIAEAVTGKHGSQGFDTIRNTYVQNLRATVDVDNLSGWQKHFAGIDNSGKIAELNPNKTTGNPVTDWFRNLVKTTDETKMFDIQQMTTDFLGNVVFDTDAKLWQIPDLVEQATGRVDITPDSPLYPFQNTAMMNTLREAFSGVDDGTIAGIRNSVLNYRQFAQNRAVVDYVAQQLGMSVDDVFNALDNKGIDPKDPQYKDMGRRERKRAMDAERRELFKKIEDAGLTFTDSNGKVLDAQNIIKSINVFKNPTDGNRRTVGRKQYSETYLKATIMEDIAGKVDDYNLKKFNIKPDHWSVRMSNLAKSMQSIALLNFSTSYQVNNFLNNMLTRSVVGVGGIDTDFINTVNAKRGLFFSRDSDTYDKSQKAVKKAKTASGVLQKFDDMYNNVAQKKLLKGVNNINVEGMETNAAFNIGANRYWQATWANTIPDIPDSWQSLGITKDMQQQIFKLALDSPSMDEFRKRIAGEVILPGAASTLDQMVANKYSDTEGKIIRDYFATKPWISDVVDAFMETGDERLITRGFDDLLNEIASDLELDNVVEMQSTYDDLRNTYANEGLGAAALAFEALNNLYSQIWISQTRENGNLFLDRLMRNIADIDFDTRYETSTNLQTNDYHIARGYTIMNIAALIDGLGISDDAAIGLVSSAMSMYDIGEEYIKARHDIYQRYAKKDSKTYDFKKYRAETIDACTKAMNAQLEATGAMHKTMVDYLRSNLAPEWTGHIDNFERALNEVLNLKKAENDAEILDLTKRIDTDGKRRRFIVSNDQEPARVARKQQIQQAYNDCAKALKQMEGAMPKNTALTKTMTIAETLRLEMLYEQATAYSNKSGEFLEKWQKKKSRDRSKVYEPINYENKNVKTTFVDYAMQKIANDAVAAGLDPKQALTNASASFIIGDAVNLGVTDATLHLQFVDEATRSFVDHPVLDHFQLLNPNADPKVTGSKYSMIRSEPYSYNGQIVTAGVYEGGKVIAYITEGMEKSITVNGTTYPVIGISPDNPNAVVLYVGDKTRVVTPGQPKGVNYSIYAKENFHPGGIGTTPTIEPRGRAVLESSAGIREAINLWKDQAISDLHKAQSNGSFYGKLNDTQKAAVLGWMDSLNQAYNSQRFQTQRYGETMVDAALLNYNKRYGFDNMLTMISPYQFWMTRSIVNWGQRMISQPAWFSMYARLEKLIEKNKKDFLPTRLEGWVGLPMPHMGDGMGSAWFFDITPTLLPFQQFYKATDYFQKNLNTIHKNTITMIEEMYENGTLHNGQPITQEEYYEAMESKGDLYWEIFNELRANDESDTSASGLMGTFFGPPVWFDALRKHLAGKDKDISYSPMYRLGNMIKATGDDTWFEDLTNAVGGVLQAPENALRRAAGIESNPDGNFANYGIITNIANMVTNNEISIDDARDAIAEGEGNEIWDTALFQYRQTQAYRQQGGALATELGQWIGGNKETSAGQIAGSAVASVFGAKVLPDGELQHREQQAVKKYIQDSGDEETLDKFWDDFPEYSVHNYAYVDDPEMLLHRVLLDNLKTAYYSLPETQQTAAQRSLGQRFNTLFVNKDTRAYDFLDDEEIIEWTRAMQGNVPNFSNEQITAPAQQAQQITWYVDSVQADYDRFQRDFDKKFPGYDVVNEGYYKVPESMRKQYLVDNPMLQKAWDYRRSAIEANPRLSVYLNDRSAQYKVNQGQYDDITDALMSNLNDWTKSRLREHIQYGWNMNASAEKTLKKTYASLMTNVPYETWLKSLVK